MQLNNQMVLSYQYTIGEVARENARQGKALSVAFIHVCFEYNYHKTHDLPTRCLIMIVIR